ncbi:MAG TPA: hypothetical protein VHW23_34155 [Kofleriaceae bacterium]|nr:hypothetical protein [Kofleriaceae bacterium]
MTGTDGGGTQRVCPLPMTTADAGMLNAVKTQLCNYPGSMGAQHWYRVFATLPGSTMNYVQLELYDKFGVFANGTVHTGTFTVDPDPSNCGVCVRGMGDKGAGDAKEYFATTGTVNITAVGAAGTTLSATMSNLGFVELDTSRKPVSGGCTAAVTAGQISGMVMQVGGTGGGGGGGGGGGMCLQTIGD